MAGEFEARADGIEAGLERQSSEDNAAVGLDEKQLEPEQRLLVWWARCGRESLREQHHDVDEAFWNGFIIGIDRVVEYLGDRG